MLIEPTQGPSPQAHRSAEAAAEWRSAVAVLNTTGASQLQGASSWGGYFTETVTYHLAFGDVTCTTTDTGSGTELISNLGLSVGFEVASETYWVVTWNGAPPDLGYEQVFTRVVTGPDNGPLLPCGPGTATVSQPYFIPCCVVTVPRPGGAGPDDQVIYGTGQDNVGGIAPVRWTVALRRNDCDTSIDSDDDGLSDCREIDVGTHPFNPDTDGDGLLDGPEDGGPTDPLDPDTDNDGLNDGQEGQLGTNPVNPDTDGDGLLDGPEDGGTTDPLDPDTDNDGLNDGQEGQLGTNPVNPDTDGGGIDDGDELNNGTDPLNPGDDSRPQCSDGADNDGDSKVDLADPGCTSPEDDDELGDRPPCDPVLCAPLLIFHREERFWPISASAFISDSELRFAHDLGCSDHIIARRGSVEAERLGHNPDVAYRHQNARARPFCDVHFGDFYNAWDFTRPYGDTVDGRPADRIGLPLAEGFYLDLLNGSRHGFRSDVAGVYRNSHARVYYDFEPSEYLTYWFTYGWSQSPYFRELKGVPYNLQLARCCHEGEWERISIRLDDENRPLEAAYYQHHEREIVEWELVELTDGTHPVVYVAEGAHASYRDRGQGICVSRIQQPGTAYDLCGDGRHWVTWDASQNSLEDVNRQPWWGFGGAWGDIGPVLGSLPSQVRGNTTGPVGPSTYSERSPWN